MGEDKSPPPIGTVWYRMMQFAPCKFGIITLKFINAPRGKRYNPRFTYVAVKWLHERRFRAINRWTPSLYDQFNWKDSIEEAISGHRQLLLKSQDNERQAFNLATQQLQQKYNCEPVHLKLKRK